MFVRLLLSVGLLACHVAADTTTTPGDGIVRVLLRYETGDNGKILYDGVYIYKNGQSKKLLDEASAMYEFYEPYLIAYLGGKDGIYKYDDSTEKLEKYGTINDRIIGMTKSNNTDTLYIITEDKSVYKVTEGGTKKTKVEGVEGAQRIELDWDDNLYFIGTDNQPYVVTVDGIKKIQGFPLIKGTAPFFKTDPTVEHGLYLITVIDRVAYQVFSDGTSTLHELSAEEKATQEKEDRVIDEMIESLQHLDEDKLGGQKEN